MIRLNPCNTARIEKLLQAFVFKCFDHAIYYTAYCAIRNNFFTRYSIDSITLQNVIFGALTVRIGGRFSMYCLYSMEKFPSIVILICKKWKKSEQTYCDWIMRYILWLPESTAYPLNQILKGSFPFTCMRPLQKGSRCTDLQ